MPANSQELVILIIIFSVLYEEFLDVQVEDFTFAALPFDHPLYILFSSGTTGKPKCLVHSAGGTLIQHLKEHQIHGNMSRDDIIFQYTTVNGSLIF